MLRLPLTLRSEGAFEVATLRAGQLGQQRATSVQTALRLCRGRSLLGGLGAAALTAAGAAALAPRTGSGDAAGAEAQSKGALVLRGSKYCITFDRSWDPSGVGRIVVTPRGDSAPTSDDFVEFLDTVKALSGRQSELKGGFVAIFDSTNMVWPSMLSIPKIVSVLSCRPPPTELRVKTRAIAIVQGDGRWLGMVVTYLVDLVVTLTKPKLVPMMASSREAAEELCAQQLRSRC